MPNNEEHAQHTYRLYGIFAYDLHQWIDAPSKTHGRRHRRFRHDHHKPPPLSAIEKYGYNMARKIQIAHFKLDGVLLGPAAKLPIWQEGDWIYKRMPNGKTYKKQLNGKQTSRDKGLKNASEGFIETKRFMPREYREMPWVLTNSTVTRIEGISISFSVKSQPMPQSYQSPRFTCPKCEGVVEVETPRSSKDYKYPAFCVHCGYDLRGACLIASQRKKEWV